MIFESFFGFCMNYMLGQNGGENGQNGGHGDELGHLEDPKGGTCEI